MTSSGTTPASGTAGTMFGSFGELLKYLRRRARLTQADLAIAVGYSREQITKLENGQRLPELATVRALFLPALELDPHDAFAAQLVRLADAAHLTKPDTNSGLKTAANRPPQTNIPLPLTRFVGRNHEVAEVKRLVTHIRLVALTGAGGVGKTRLALHVGAELQEQFPDGVWLVEFASVAEPLLVPHAVAAVFGLATAAAQSLHQVLADYVRDKRLLLILDNCEHLLVSCASLAETLLRAAPRVHILATSRESLGVLSATGWQVPSLTLPAVGTTPEFADVVTEVLDSEAVQLFVDRARMVKPTWSLTPTNTAAVVTICRRLDGVPLALELAATRVRAMSVEQIAERLDDRFRLLAGGNSTALPRHQTLRAAVDWSYELLNETERAVLRQLSVFVGGWSLEAAEWTCGTAALDAVMQLVDKSLVLVDDRERILRYRMPETIRQYGRDKLDEADKVAEARRKHLDWCQHVVRQASPFLPARRSLLWYESLEHEHDDVQAALAWAIQHEPEAAVEIVAGVWHFWFWRGYWREGIEWAQRVFAAASMFETAAGARALVGAANLAGRGGNETLYSTWLTEGNEIAEKLGVVEAQVYAKIALSLQSSNDRQALALLDEALGQARAARNTWLTATVLSVLGDRARTRGEYTQAAAYYDESLARFQQMGSSDMVPWPLGNLGRIAFETDDYVRARTAFAESVERCRALGNRPGTADWLLQLALAELICHNYNAAQAALAECLPVCRAIGNAKAMADCFVIMAGVAEAQGQLERAAQLLGTAGSMLEQFSALHHAADWAGEEEYQRRVVTVQAKLGEAAFRAAQAESRRRTLDQAIADTLDQRKT